jgi:nucleotide-binding universal stress UspA family protein
MKAIDRMLVATDFSDCAAAAAVVAAQLARQLRAAVDVVTVVDTSPLADAYGDAVFRTERIAQIHAEARMRTESFARHHFADGTARAHVRDGATFAEILQAAKDLGADLIVMGTHGQSGLVHLLVGSVADRVVRKSAIPVLTVRAPT